MAKKRGKTPPRDEKQKKIGLFLLQVVKATNEVELPINQTEARKSLKSNHRIGIPPATSTEYASLLTSDDLGRTWLKQEGHSISLFSEEETLVDSKAIKALFLAHTLIDENDCVSVEQWTAECGEKLKITPATCKSFITEFTTCSYATGNEDGTGVIRLDVRAFNEDLFYLREAKNANLTKRLSRKKRAKD